MTAGNDATDRRAQLEAFVWLERLERTLRDAEGMQLRKWLKKRRHRDAIVSRSRLWHGPEVLALLGEMISVAEPTPRDERDARVMLVLSVVMAIVSVGLLFTFAWRSSPKAPTAYRLDEAYRTQVGEREDVRLPDGSLITLNTATRVLVNFGPKSRDATLLAGEASFDVTKDAARPFRLQVGPRALEAQDSRFSVRRSSREESDIAVVDGEVRVLFSPQLGSLTPAQLRNTHTYGAATVHAMQGGVLGAGWQSIQAIDRESLQAQLAWRQGLIVFANTPLDSAVTEIERYTPRRFVLADELRDVRVTARLRSAELEDFLQLLRDQHIGVRYDAQGRIVLSSALGAAAVSF